jgi:hypothetical protein
MPQCPIEVSKRVKPCAVMLRSYHLPGPPHLENLALDDTCCTEAVRAPRRAFQALLGMRYTVDRI